MKITTLAENFVMTKCLGQWGLSLLLELIDSNGNERKVVFDTGIHKKSLLYNLKQLKVDLCDVDCLVISHGHADHTSATVEIVEAADGINVYAHPHTFQPRFYEDKTGKRRQHGVPKNEGVNEIERAGGKVILASESIEIVPGVWTTGQIRRVTSFERVSAPSKGERRIIIIDGEEISDQVLDDQALWMNVEKFGLIVVTGCAHAGLLNTLLQVQKLGNFEDIYGLVGGTHLIGRSDRYLQRTFEELKKFRLGLISPCHCTGFKAMTRFWQVFPKVFLLNFSGRIIEVKKEPRKRLF